MLSDKDVGKLWLAAKADSGVQVRADVFRNLIRKLIEERKRYYQDISRASLCGYCSDVYVQETVDRQYVEAESTALADFGIDPSEWDAAAKEHRDG